LAAPVLINAGGDEQLPVKPPECTAAYVVVVIIYEAVQIPGQLHGESIEDRGESRERG